MSRTPGFSTRAIHVGSEPDPATGSVIPPIYQTSTYAQDGVGGLRTGLGVGYEYSRSGNPTRTAFESAFAAVETAGEEPTRALSFASGLAAEDAVVRTLTRPGDHVVLPGDAYGGTYRLFARVAEPWGVAFDTAPSSDVDAVRAAVQPGRTRFVWVETPTNPLLGITDIAAVAAVAHEAGALLVVDNTFATPYLQNPLELGADVVVHSTTKYVGGHSDVVGGALVVRAAGAAGAVTDPHTSEPLADRLAWHQNAMGAVSGPFDAWLTLRGLKTLAVRMERHSASAAQVAQFLVDHPAVSDVLYPGLPGHPGHDVAARQMRLPGGMVSFRLRRGRDAALKTCASTGVFTLAESLGGIESLIEHPGAMTHASVAGSPLEVPDDLVRLSVGLEDVDDLLADLDAALAAASA
ncbi:cystathionine gamma-synthase [Aquipuribacter nitratireducens]|uniref:Cystathionine gamma-synthase n=1 Tax=Aquipuribacter nitratireducens TaxID=650104 RepID=A0ABW0GIJ8_9MICO